jgi:hypothetical protein
MINMDHFMIKYPLLWAKKMLIVLVIVAVLIEKYMALKLVLAINSGLLGIWFGFLWDLYLQPHIFYLAGWLLVWLVLFDWSSIIVSILVTSFLVSLYVTPLRCASCHYVPLVARRTKVLLFGCPYPVFAALILYCPCRVNTPCPYYCLSRSLCSLSCWHYCIRCTHPSCLHSFNIRCTHVGNERPSAIARSHMWDLKVLVWLKNIPL